MARPECRIRARIGLLLNAAGKWLKLLDSPTRQVAPERSGGLPDQGAARMIGSLREQFCPIVTRIAAGDELRVEQGFLAVVAQRLAVEIREKALALLPNLTGACVACHYSWRTR